MKRRRVLIVLLLLVAGAIANVVVAWLPITDWLNTRGQIVNSVRGQWSSNEVQHAFSARLILFPSSPSSAAPPGIVVEPLQQRLAEYTNDCMMEAERIDNSAAGDRVQFAIISGRGYPMLALRGSVIVIDVFRSRALPTRDLRPKGMLLFNQKEPEFLYLPTIPIWPGFAINTVFYAVILWLLFAGPFVLRRRRRIRRGLCPQCAYDLRSRPTDSSACPECGATHEAK